MISQSDTFARAILAALGSGMIAAAALALVVAAAGRCLRPSATTRHVLWWIVFSAAALLPLATVATSLQRIEHRPASGVRADERRVERGGTVSARSTASVASTVPASTTLQAPADRSSRAAIDYEALGAHALDAIARVPDLPSALVALWLAIAAVRLGLLVPGIVWLLRTKRAALPLDESIVRRLRRYRHGMRLGRTATILLSADIDVPIAVGFGKPAILLPIAVAESEAIADLDHIVMHEHAHLNRYDDVTNLIQCLVERIFWFNPIIAFAGRRISLEREIACDDSVVAQTGRAHRYATCLWKLVESARLPARPVMAPGALLTPKQITRRIEQLLDSKRNALPRLSPTTAIMLAALGAGVIFFQAERAPVIALEDPAAPAAPAPAPPAAPADVAKAPVPAALPTPAPRHVPHSAEHPAPAFRFESDATPEAMANAVIAATLERSMKTLKRATNARTPDVAMLGATMGLDVAKTITEKLAPASEWPQIERSIERAKSDAQRAIAMNDVSRAVAFAPAGNHRMLRAFHRIEVDGSTNVIVRRGAATSVDFQHDENVSSHTRTTVDNGTLVIDQTDGSYDDNDPKPIIIYTPNLDAVTIDGSADAVVENASAADFAIDISGSGNVTARGTVSSASVTIDGSGDADLLDLHASTISIASQGSGNVKLAAPKTLAIHIHGSGDVSIHGTPKTLSTDINGSGSISYI